MLTSNLFLLSIAVLTLVVCVVLGVVLYFALHGAGDKPAAERKIVRLRSDSLRSTFRQAVELIEGNIASRGERYNIPWVMVLDEGDNEPPLPIAQAGVSSVLGTDASSAAATQGIAWHFFDRGVVIDIKATYLGSLDDDSDEKPWDEFLGLCRNYRPQRPFDSVVITVPAAMLLATDTDARLELERRAKLAHRRLWLAQNRFAMRFAVYVVVTGCEALEGFADFACALPEPLRASMLGWSSPYDLSTTYSSDWVEAATTTVSRAVSDTSAEIFALDGGQLDAREFLLLPARIEAMQSQLQLYVDELMRPSAYHEPFFFRGIYLTGDSSELAAQWVARPEAPQFDDGEPTFGSASEPKLEPKLDPAAADADADADAQAALGQTALVQPAFLRDLFERKIFLEYGLTRPSGSQRLPRPVLNRALRWGGIAILGVWGIGMVVATVQFSHRNSELASALGQLRGDTQERAEAAQRGQELSADWYRRKALALISLDQHLKNDAVWSVFMPGSWGIVDDLDQRVSERFEREFGEIAVTALQREMFARVGQLTGVGIDPSSGQLIIGDDCTAPPLPRNGANGDSLAIEDQPEMLALKKYVDSTDQFDAALQALQRLQHAGQDNSDALRLVVRYTLGAELQGDVSGVLPYFYANGRAARHVDVTSGLNVPALSQALRCTFDKGASQLNQRLFVNNPLLASEKSVADHLNALSVMDPGATDFSHVAGSYRDTVAAINVQQDLLAAGKAGWLHQTQFMPGPLYERTMQRAAQDRLLGEDLAAGVRARDDTAFQAFRSELALRFGGPDSGVVWLDKDARYAVAPARLALRDGLTTLLNQPFMVAPRGLSLPSLPAGATLVWDNAQLDQALALADTRKHFQTDGLTKLPAAIQPIVGQAVDAQFARLVFDQTAAAAAIAPVGSVTGSAAFDATHTRLAAIEALLTGMGATGQAGAIANLESQDALAHLAAVDTALSQSDLYATRDSVGYAGGAAPELAAFGVSSATGLGMYLDQQAARALALGKDASVYLAALTPTDAASGLAQRWQAIDLDLDRYKLKNPNSSLLRLEQFVQSLGDPGAGGCMDRFAGRPGSGGADDYFAELHARLYSTLMLRCRQSYANDLRQEWEGFSSAFNQNVAGLAPFNGPGFESVAYPGAAAHGGSADFGTLGQVLKLYRGVSDRFSQAKTATRAGVGPLAVRRFIESFDQVQTLLAPLYPADGGAPTGYDVNVDFRVNRGAEVAGNQVIDWTLSIGGQSLSAGDVPHSLHWDYGTPVTLVLRLAKDAPYDAASDPQQGALSTDGDTLTWQFSDPWALITFIARQRVPDTSLRADGAAQLLKFEFPLGAKPVDLSSVPKTLRARVFLRVSLSPAGKKTPLPWPGNFPARAPEWSVL